jgi:hypothetical protein
MVRQVSIYAVVFSEAVVFHPSAGSCGSSYWLCRTIQQAGLPTAYNLPNAYIQILNGRHARI